MSQLLCLTGEPCGTRANCHCSHCKAYSRQYGIHTVRITLTILHPDNSTSTRSYNSVQSALADLEDDCTDAIENYSPYKGRTVNSII